MLPNPDILNDYSLGKFVLSNLAAKRAKQLREGALPLVQIESRHPLTIALAEIAAGKIEPRMFATGADLIGDTLDVSSLGDDILGGEFGMLLPALDENESVLIDTEGVDDHEAETESDTESSDDDGELSLSDLAEGEDEEETTPVDSDEDTLSLSDIAEEEEALSDDTVSDEE
ncbi:MAG: DNA-directed RNA polymerase subunit omega [Armatimonadetes bacterium]|nr:DNA-directed RNA polymerase subunit omega [Armatimonadota bacterium]MBS1700288.1 DNA-directed RNA polymerase subunit omega [Armatimonadota bacterium]MBS1728626.1 DNA-directed RNA polymerase subunit omega [Armatimonadota bacterium]